MITSGQIKSGTPVVCSENGQFAVVDHMEGSDTIKLNKDNQGQHHYIPLNWVSKVDDKVHIDRPKSQAVAEWSNSPKVTKADFNGKDTSKSQNADSQGATSQNGHSQNASSKVVSHQPEVGKGSTTPVSPSKETTPQVLSGAGNDEKNLGRRDDKTPGVHASPKSIPDGKFQKPAAPRSPDEGRVSNA